jgi:transporter family-2 protein
VNHSPSTAGTAAILFVMFLTGIGIPILATMNAQLGTRLASPTTATALLFVVGLIASTMIALVAPKPAPGAFAAVPPYLYLAALLMVFYILSVTFAAPRVGLGNAIFLVLLGQLVSAAIIDHYGLLGAIRSEVTPRRAIGLLVMALGVYLARKPR